MGTASDSKIGCNEYFF